MNKDSFLPRIFAYCGNFNTPACRESGNIQNDLGTRIEPLEIRETDEYPDARDIGRIIVEISNGYCQNCSNFLAQKGLLE
jgi:hypothetical protein